MDQSKLKVFWKVLRGRLAVSFFLMGGLFVLTRWVLPVVYQPPATVVLAEVGEPQVIRLRKNFGDGPVHHLKIKVTGQLNGTSIMRVFQENDSDHVYREKLIGSGKVEEILIDQDWYEDGCRLAYEPLSAAQGSLKIEYRFQSAQIQRESH